MATWVRNGTGTHPSATDANVTGTMELDNGTAPADFDAAAVNSVRIQYRTEIGSGTFASPEDHDVLRAVDLTLNGDGAHLASIAGASTPLDGGSDPVDTDETDSSPSLANSTAEWEGAELNPNATDWTTFNQNMGPDGVLVQIASTVQVVTVTIDYTPAVAAFDIVPDAVTVTVAAGSLVATVGSVAITPTGGSVSVTPSSLTVTTGSLPITPGAVTVTVAPGSVVATVGAAPISLTGASVSVAPGSAVLTTGSVAIAPTGAAVSVAAGTTVLTLAQNVVPDATTVTVAPGSMIATVGSVAVVPAPVTVTVAGGTLVVTQSGAGQNIIPEAVTVTVAPGTLTATTGPVAVVPDAVTVSVSAGTMVLSSGGDNSYRAAAAGYHGEVLFLFLTENDAGNFTSIEVVGALNDINGTTGIGYWEARSTYLDAA